MNTHPPETDSSEALAMAQYIGAMARDLRGLAASAGLPFIAYLLAMVEEDASSLGRSAAHGKKRN